MQLRGIQLLYGSQFWLNAIYGYTITIWESVLVNCNLWVYNYYKGVSLGELQFMGIQLLYGSQFWLNAIKGYTITIWESVLVKCNLWLYNYHMGVSFG